MTLLKMLRKLIFLEVKDKKEVKFMPKNQILDGLRKEKGNDGAEID